MADETISALNRKRLHWELITALMMFAGYAALMLCRTTLIAASPTMVLDPKLGLDKAKYGRLMSWHSAGAIAGKLALGVGADKLGGRSMFLIAILFTAISTAAFGMTSGFLLFAVLNFFGQFFKSGGWPAMAKIIGDWYSRSKHGRVWSFISTSSRVGTISAGLLIGALLFNFFGGSIAQTYGWSVFLAGLISIAVLALVTMTWFLHLNANAEQQPA